MLRRSALLSLAALVLLSVAACSRSENKPAPSTSRTLSAIWVDMLEQRDTIHGVFAKELEEVTHQDCADVGAAAHRLDDLTSEFMNTVGATSRTDDGKLRTIGNAASHLIDVLSKVRETALAESPGAWPELRFPVDFALLQVEQSIRAGVSAGALGESVTSRPGFETQPLPAPPSPI